MQFWDESRNANNALEAAMDGHWLVPTYKGVADHWNTKPPLLIWLIAALLKLGLPPLWALRAPSIAAAAATVATLWSVLRFGLQDRTAAFVAAALLLTSTLYDGIHVAHTGDYDTLVSLFVLGTGLCLWRAVGEPVRPGRLFAATACLAAAILTKGVTAGLAGPGFALFILARPRRALALIRDTRTWIAAGAVLAVAAGYYLSRETYDPGYLRAVASNELGGRFSAVIEGHDKGLFFYLDMLFHGFEPGLLLLPLSLLTLSRPSSPRRDLAWITLAGAVSLLVTVSAARTKLFWYTAPALPLLSITAALGVADALRWLAARQPRLGFEGRLGIGGLLAVMGACAIYQNQTLTRNTPPTTAPLVMYGPFLAELRRSGQTEPATLVDTGFWGYRVPPYYDPITDFYRRLYRDRWPIGQLGEGRSLAQGALAITCDGASATWLRQRYALTITRQADGCLMARVRPLAPISPPLAPLPLASGPS